MNRGLRRTLDVAHPVRGRTLRIVLTDAAPSWSSIADLNLIV